MDKYIKTDVPGLVKDFTSGAVLNIDNAKLNAYRRQKKLYGNQAESEQRICNMETELSQIKQLLVSVLEKLEVK